MDEDEKEMLSEARARLANTRGKKAKRKAREKQLEEARRLAALQKRRELKAAGISVTKKYRSRKSIDYATEIPFEAVPPLGFHETGSEEPKVTLGLANVTLQAVENRNRDKEEQRMRKDDERKLKRLKQDNLPETIEMINKLNDPQQLRKRTSLNLPAPQLADEELEQIVKMGADAAALAAQSADSSTVGLVQSYGETPGSTPLRTPRQQNTILVEAQDAIARNSMQTPLYGDENPQMHETDWAGALPRKTGGITPNIYAEQARQGGTPGATPGGTPRAAQRALGLTPGTPQESPTVVAGLRDCLSLNGDVDMDMPKLKHQMQLKIKAQLDNLPEPANDLEISMPELGNEADPVETLEKDAEDVDKEYQQEQKKLRDRELAKTSEAVKRDLPRPLVPKTMLFSTFDAPGSIHQAEGRALVQQAESLLHEEMAALVTSDAVLHPIKGVKLPKDQVSLTEYSMEELVAAKDLLSEEIGKFDAHGQRAGEFTESVWHVEDDLGHLTFLPKAKSYMEWRMLGKDDRLEAAQHLFDLAEKQLQAETKRAKKLENKMNVALGGHLMHVKRSTDQTAQLIEEATTLATDVEVFQTLRTREEVASRSRIEDLQEAVEREKERNAQLQFRYKALKRKHRVCDERLQ